MEFSRQEYWSGLPLISPGYLPNSGIEHVSRVSPASASGFLTTVPQEISQVLNLNIPILAVAAAKSLQSCSTLHDPTDGSPPDSSVCGILKARILEWAAISFSDTHSYDSVN